MGACMIDGVILFLVWDSKKKTCTIQRSHITKDITLEGSNGKGDITTLCDHETRSVFMNPPQLTRGGMRAGGKV